MSAELVSVITPCYNTGAYIHRLLESVLSQTYPAIEMFVIDDGSTDNSAEVVRSYIPKFEQRGYTLQLIQQPNSGQSVAIQNGLDRISGTYLVWPDSDDYYGSSEAIAKMVSRLKTAGPEVAMVRVGYSLVSDSPAQNVIGHSHDNGVELESESLFDDCLLHTNDFYFCSGGYMIEVAALRQSSEFPIYTSKGAGQNWQLMLPILYHYRCISIREYLYCVVYRVDSHSRRGHGYEANMRLHEIHHAVISNTLDNILKMTENDRKELHQRVDLKYAKVYLDISIGAGLHDRARQYYKQLKSAGKVTFLERLRYTLFCIGLYRLVVPIARKLFRK